MMKRKSVKVFDTMDEAKRTIPPGSQRRVLIGSQKFCLANVRGVFYAFEDSCPHLGYSLAKGNINSDLEIVCPWHSYRFNLVTGEPSSPCRSLRIIRVNTENGLSLEF